MKDGPTQNVDGDEQTGTKGFRSSPPMRELLDKLSSARREIRNPKRQGQDFIMTVAECRKALSVACKKVGIKHIIHHDLRHFFATQGIESGIDIPTVSRWLGHKDGGALAMKTYGHLRDEHSQTMAQRVTFRS
jgi:integrase